jgi:hypothetical protein
MADTIALTPRQLQKLLKRFAKELENRGGKVADADIDDLATRLVDELSPTCRLTESQRVLNSNVVIKLS